MEKEYVLGMDSGTTYVKILAVDKKGKVVGEGSEAHEPFTIPKPEWAEQNSEDWWNKFCKVCKKATVDLPKDKIAALGITTQRGTMVCLDEKGNVLGRAVLWIDRRIYEDPEDKGNRFVWTKRHEPEIYKKTYKFMGVQAWFVHRLTGEWKDSYAACSPGFGQQNFVTFEWDKKQFEKIGIPVEMMVDIYPPGEVLGHVTKKAAEETGLPEGLPVVGGAGDKQSGTLGAGCVEPGMLMVSYGTALTVGTTSYTFPKKVPPYPMPSGIAGAWNPECGISGGFWMVTWFRDQFSQKEVELAKGRGVSPEKVMDEEADKTPVGSLGLMVQPYWWGGWGACPPDPFIRGAAIGWRGTHTRAHYYRAILEGCAYGARGIREILEDALEVKYKDSRVVAGGSNSDLVLQITADILGIPAHRTNTPAAEALGAAIDAAKGGGLYKSVKEAAENMVHITKTFTPIPKNVELYDRLYKEVYLKVYESNKEMYKKTMEILGG